MPPRNLRRGDRQPKPGAVFKGCPRPKALRFDSPLGGRSPFGDGSYSGNIMQGGVALQPQDYLLDGITPLPRCIVVTGAATVAPDAATGAAVWMAHNVALIGASASLSASTNCKGLLGFVNGLVALRGGAHLHMDRIGKAGNFGDLSPDMLLPTRLRTRIACGTLKAYKVCGVGAPGGGKSAVASRYDAAPGNPGAAAGPMQTGGGGGGQANGPGNSPGYSQGGAGACGGPCCGGAGGGTGLYNSYGGDAFPFGGPGGYGGHSSWGTQSLDIAGGAGDPCGVDWFVNMAPAYVFKAGAGGGLLALFARDFDMAAACVVSADGSPGTIPAPSNGCSKGSGAGGGCVVIVTRRGGYRNAGTVRAAGGIGQDIAGAGGAGSVNIFELAA